MRASTLAPLALPVLLVLLAACGSQQQPLAPQETRLARPGAGGADAAIDAALVGTWRRTLLLTDQSGAALSAETIWSFRSDGSARREIITRNFSSGVSDVTVSLARWSTQGDLLVITFTGIEQGTVRLTYRVDAGVLVLGGQGFFRE
jgi:hypothetical protein